MPFLWWPGWRWAFVLGLHFSSHPTCARAPRIHVPYGAGSPRCPLWHGWLPGLSAADQRAPWADSLGPLADRDRSLELVLGAYPVDDSGPELGDAEDWRTPLCVRTDGSLEPCPAAGISGVHKPAPEFALQGPIWGVVEECGDAVSLAPPPSGSVCGILRGHHGFAGLLAGSSGIDNLNVVRAIARLLGHGSLSLG